MSAKQATLTGDIIEETIPTGYIKCFVSGKLRKNTPEERVRQEVAKSLVYEYGYDVTDMEVEFPIQMGRKRPRADLVIFYEGKTHTKENVYIVIETKKPDIKPSDKNQGVDQLASYLYACPNAKYGLWVGSERIALEVVEKEGKKSVVQIPDIPPKGEKTTPRPVRSKLVPAINLKQVFKRIHNYIYANQGLQKDKAFEELLKLIFAQNYLVAFSKEWRVAKSFTYLKATNSVSRK
jgi:type I restriction enzyme M protein